MSKHDNWMPLYIGDYLGDTPHLDGPKSGAYLHLLMHYWRNGPLPDDDGLLAAIAKTQPKSWKAMRQVIRAFFSVGTDGRLHQKRMDAERAKCFDISDKRREAGHGGAGKKWNKPISDNAEPSNGEWVNPATARSRRLAEARRKGTHTQEEWEALLEICEYRCVRCGREEVGCKDHIQPIYKGGSDAIDNIQPLCRRCNSQKGPEDIDHRPPDWRDKMPGKTPGKNGADAWQNACQTPGPVPDTVQTSTVRKESKELELNSNIIPMSRARVEPTTAQQIGVETQVGRVARALATTVSHALGKKPERDREQQIQETLPPKSMARPLNPEQLAIARRLAGYGGSS